MENMYIKKIIIENFKCFEGKFSLDFNGKYIGAELTQALFNNKVIIQFLESLKTDNQLQPPHIMIELYFDITDESLKARFEGNGNSLKEKECGIQFKINFDEKYKNEYMTKITIRVAV